MLRNYLLIALALVSGLYLTWRFTQPELAGHWHVSESLGTDNNGMKGIYHFNVDQSGEIRVNEAIKGKYILPGSVEKLSRRIYFGGECWYVSADYQVWGDRMELRGEDSFHGNWRAVAYRTKAGDCDPERDYFEDLPFPLRLPVANETELEPLPEKGFEVYSFQMGEERQGRRTRLLANGYLEIETVADLDLLEEHSATKQRVFGKSPDKILLFQDASAEVTAELKLLKTKFSDQLGFAGYFRVYHVATVDGRLELGCKWVEF